MGDYPRADIFSYHPNPSDEQKVRHERIEQAFNRLCIIIHDEVINPRYKAIAITELEKAGAMAVKGVYKNSDGTFITHT
jgi:hypothetical protein